MTLLLENELRILNNIPGAVTLEEAIVLASLVAKIQAKRCLEIGVANGASALALAQAVSELGGHLDGIDPCQLEEHQSAALNLLEKYRLRGAFTLHPQPTHLAAPKLLEQGRKFDLIFIDGMHNFEFKCLDVFYSDRLLEVGGLLILHDATFRSTKKIISLLQTTGRYEIEQTPSLHLSWIFRLRRLAKAVAKMRSYAWFWPNGFANLVVLKKTSNTEVSWNFFQNF